MSDNNSNENIFVNDLADDYELDQVTLTLEDDSELLCDVISVFDFNDKQYIALCPVENPDGDIFLYGFKTNGDEEFDLIDIEDDEEFEAVSEYFDELVDSQEYEDMFGDEDEANE